MKPRKQIYRVSPRYLLKPIPEPWWTLTMHKTEGRFFCYIFLEGNIGYLRKFIERAIRGEET